MIILESLGSIWWKIIMKCFLSLKTFVLKWGSILFYLWALCKLKLELNPYISGTVTEAKNLHQRFKERNRESSSKDGIYSNNLAYMAWKKNSRIFNQQKLHKVMVFRRLDVNNHLKTCNWKQALISKLQGFRKFGRYQVIEVQL